MTPTHKHRTPDDTTIITIQERYAFGWVVISRQYYQPAGQEQWYIYDMQKDKYTSTPVSGRLQRKLQRAARRIAFTEPKD